jgi:hypothetical protein
MRSRPTAPRATRRADARGPARRTDRGGGRDRGRSRWRFVDRGPPAPAARVLDAADARRNAGVGLEDVVEVATRPGSSTSLSPPVIERSRVRAVLSTTAPAGTRADHHIFVPLGRSLSRANPGFRRLWKSRMSSVGIADAARVGIADCARLRGSYGWAVGCGAVTAAPRCDDREAGDADPVCMRKGVRRRLSAASRSPLLASHIAIGRLAVHAWQDAWLLKEADGHGQEERSHRRRRAISRTTAWTEC